MPASEPVRWMERAPSTLHPPLRSSVRVAALGDAGRRWANEFAPTQTPVRAVVGADSSAIVGGLKRVDTRNDL